MIAGLDLNLEELWKSAGYLMDMITKDADPAKPTPLEDHLRAAPGHLLRLLKDTPIECIKNSFTLLHSHFPTTPLERAATGIAIDFDVAIVLEVVEK